MKIPVFYDEKMVVNLELESPSPQKPKYVVKEWIDLFNVEIQNIIPASVEDFYLAHNKNHIDGLLNLTIPNGMDTKDQEVIDSLFWTVGSMINASEYALNNQIAVSPTSGFHHAGYNYSWGFCTVNGLMISAIKLLTHKKVKIVGILDFDYHQGDGSEDIIKELNLSGKVINLTSKTSYRRDNSKAFFKQLPSLLNKLKEVDIILYQAGADQHINDPLGGFLNSGELRLRDKYVFEFAKDNRIPIVWNLAGGYQEDKLKDKTISIQKILDIHNITMEECIKIYK